VSTVEERERRGEKSEWTFRLPPAQESLLVDSLNFTVRIQPAVGAEAGTCSALAGGVRAYIIGGEKRAESLRGLGERRMRATAHAPVQAGEMSLLVLLLARLWDSPLSLPLSHVSQSVMDEIIKLALIKPCS